MARVTLGQDFDDDGVAGTGTQHRMDGRQKPIEANIDDAPAD